ncbi:hypothetical protein BT96DRAFT_428738 [Gymnopus androsaceus JB14]|uniref:Uncharacterized protein n=1 Tax=Gymnopus androsaceus JB14 TaxID=1447944 RepID=A0A6A4GS84_9AGAR|nr:hypothetical protein BT96DRAFT_428738 [Gymnopus androsaceus JB14]
MNTPKIFSFGGSGRKGHGIREKTCSRKDAWRTTDNVWRECIPGRSLFPVLVKGRSVPVASPTGTELESWEKKARKKQKSSLEGGLLHGMVSVERRFQCIRCGKHRSHLAERTSSQQKQRATAVDPDGARDGNRLLRYR